MALGRVSLGLPHFYTRRRPLPFPLPGHCLPGWSGALWRAGGALAMTGPLNTLFDPLVQTLITETHTSQVPCHSSCAFVDPKVLVQRRHSLHSFLPPKFLFFTCQCNFVFAMTTPFL
uniref:Uncharacterized protein n=1 Tax=Denticeps clupeoides TaxID=299321 RepID=A0AAY4D9H9_9TELE